MPAYTWAFQQIQEYFCDFVGTRIFGESYFHAFAYLLCPHTLQQRSEFYPNMISRVAAQIDAAKAYGASIPESYQSLFRDMLEPPEVERHRRFLLELADGAASSLVPDLIHHVDSLLSIPGIPKWKSPSMQPETTPTDSVVHESDKPTEQMNEIIEDFKAVAPTQNTGSLPNILNAAWKARHDPQLWIQHPSLSKNPDDRDRMLKELILKSIEVLEVESRILEFQKEKLPSPA
jgi:hypothetical protein